MHRLVGSASAVLLCALSLCTHATQAIPAEEAAQHIGHERTVCGLVASTKYAAASKGEPTFLNMGRPFPNHVFSAVIWGRDRPHFPRPPETEFDGRTICVSGYISVYGERPQIFVGDPQSITFEANPVPAQRPSNPVRLRRQSDGSLLISNDP
jgi:hypothetical protein